MSVSKLVVFLAVFIYCYLVCRATNNSFGIIPGSGVGSMCDRDLLRQFNGMITRYSEHCMARIHLRDCCDAVIFGNRTAVYWVASKTSIMKRRGYCDMDTRRGGWLVISRRLNPHSLPKEFVRNWKSYENGFGALNGNFWWGLKGIHEMTSQSEVEVLIELRLKSTKQWIQLHYSRFHVGGPETNYLLTVDGYNGPVLDAFKFHNNTEFSTFDRDNDGISFLECGGNPRTFQVNGWWFGMVHEGYTICAVANPLGQDGIYWLDNKNDQYVEPSYDQFEMKIRPRHFLCP